MSFLKPLLTMHACFNRFVEHGVSGIVVFEHFLLGIELQFVTQLDGNVPQVPQGGNTVPHLGRLKCFRAAADAVDKILFLTLEAKSLIFRFWL